jgi:endoglucanase
MDTSLLTMILTEPTAPFREQHVARTLAGVLKTGDVAFFEDPFGNLVVGVGSEAEYLALVGRRTAEPLRIFIAHMDHPGFHGGEWRNRGSGRACELEFEWFGGSPTRLLTGARVWVASDRRQWSSRGILRQVQLLRSKKRIASGTVQLLGEAEPPEDLTVEEVFGGFDFRKPAWFTRSRVYGRALDDLACVFCIVSVALNTSIPDGRDRQQFIGLLTRAEEAGFVGAAAHFELGWHDGAQRPLLCVSLDASRIGPGASLGRGPVIRLGDNSTVFDPAGLDLLIRLASEELGGSFQRREQDGRTCEGTVAIAHGLPTVALSIPVGNHHNESFEGGLDSRGARGPGPEFLNPEDLEGLLRLCQALVQPGLPWVSA